jgi:competence protein ComFC
VDLHPQGIKGSWRAGSVLDWHTIDSKCIGENEFGHPIFETTRSELGELLYKFKYRGDQEALKFLVDVAAKYLSETKAHFDLLVPVPGSHSSRRFTAQIAIELGKRLGIRVSESGLRKTRETPELKSILDPDQRREMLTGALAADANELSGKTILLVDDLYRSGITLETATEIAYQQGKAKAVYVFALTRTRINR